jgi:hypothetical protein
MRQRKSYEKDAFTTVIESLSTSDSDDPDRPHDDVRGKETPFPRAENHVSIISEIERRLTQFPTKVLVPGMGGKDSRGQEGALVLYRSPESMGLPRSERHHAEELKAATRKRILERRRGGKGVIGRVVDEGDGYEADAEDWEDWPVRKQGVVNGGLETNGVHRGDETMGSEDIDEDEEYGDMMDLD